MLAVGAVRLPYAYDGLIAIGFPLMLPAIAALHVRHRPLRSSGSVLGTIAGTAVVAVGLAGSVSLDLRPAALLLLGMWWWTIGKMWAQTGALPKSVGLLTAGLGVAALAAAVALPLTVDGLVPGSAATGQFWTAVHAVLGAWLLILAVALLRPAEWS